MLLPKIIIYSGNLMKKIYFKLFFAATFIPSFVFGMDQSCEQSLHLTGKRKIDQFEKCPGDLTEKHLGYSDMAEICDREDQVSSDYADISTSKTKRPKITLQSEFWPTTESLKAILDKWKNNHRLTLKELDTCINLSKNIYVSLKRQETSHPSHNKHEYVKNTELLYHIILQQAFTANLFEQSLGIMQRLLLCGYEINTQENEKIIFLNKLVGLFNTFHDKADKLIKEGTIKENVQDKYYSIFINLYQYCLHHAKQEEDQKNILLNIIEKNKKIIRLKKRITHIKAIQPIFENYEHLYELALDDSSAKNRYLMRSLKWCKELTNRSHYILTEKVRVFVNERRENIEQLMKQRSAADKPNSTLHGSQGTKKLSYDLTPLNPEPGSKVDSRGKRQYSQQELPPPFLLPNFTPNVYTTLALLR